MDSSHNTLVYETCNQPQYNNQGKGSQVISKPTTS